MTAAPSATALTPDDLLALVRRSGEKFQRRDFADRSDAAAGAEGAGAATTGFAPRPYLRAIEPDPEETAAPPEETAPQESAPPAPPQPKEAPAADTGFTPAAAPQPVDIEAERRAAWEEGHAEAMKQIEAARQEARAAALEEARAEAAAQVDEAREVFEAAIARLAGAEHEMLDGLTAKLETAVRILATKRAGQRIDEAPRPFLRRIEKMTREVAAGVDSIVVQMNPADLMAIRPLLKNASPLANAKLAPDTRLGRGDLRIKMDDVTFADVIAERTTGGLA